MHKQPFSEKMTEKLLANAEVENELIWETISNATKNLELVPVMLGSAFKNKGVQNLLDAVTRYLPSPVEREVVKTSDEVNVYAEVEAPLVALAFKLTVESFGQLTYTRIYSGTLKAGDIVYNARTKQRVQIGRLLRMHANKREEVKIAVAGDIIALLGVDCASGDTFYTGLDSISLEAMYVPEPVISLSVIAKKQEDSDKLSKALNRFQKEDPTFRVSVNAETGETLISGMGELHLEIYIERIKREYDAEVFIGQPAVAYRETITKKASFDYRFKKQTGGPGQFAHVTGWIEPCSEPFVFNNRVVGGAIPSTYITACEKGFIEAMQAGELEGYPVVGVKVVLDGGSHHPIDSNEFAFCMAAKQAFATAFTRANPQLLEPIMHIEVETPNEYVGRVQGDLSSRRGLLLGSQTMQGYSVIQAEVPLAQMFGYSTTLRSITSGMATFTMEFASYQGKV
jgi:elongation factor G